MRPRPHPDFRALNNDAIRAWLGRHYGAIAAGVNVGTLDRVKAHRFEIELIARDRAAEIPTCPGCGQVNVTVGLDSVLREIYPVFRNHACGVGGPGSAAS